MSTNFQALNKWLLLCCLLLIAVDRTLGSPVQEDPCHAELNMTTAQDFKQSFGVKLFDELSKHYIQMIFDLTPQIVSYATSLSLELPADDEHNESLQYIIQRLQNSFEHMEIPANKEDRLHYIKIYREISYKGLELLFMETEEVSKNDFFILQQKQNYTQLLESGDLEFRKFLTNAQKIWKAMYDCVPVQYLKEYKEFAAIDKLFNDVLKTIDEDNYRQQQEVIELFNRLGTFFNNEIILFQKLEISTDEYEDKCKLNFNANSTVFQFVRNFSNKLFADINKKHLEMIFIIFPKFNTYYKSILLEMPDANDIAQIAMFENMRKEAAKKLMFVEVPESRVQRRELIKIFQDLHEKFGDLEIDQTNLNYQIYMKSFKSWQREYFKNIQKIWKKMYECIPTEYLKDFENLVEIYGLLQKYLSTRENDEEFMKISEDIRSANCSVVAAWLKKFIKNFMF